MSEIAGRNVVITGAASGIGRLMALELAKKGGNVAGWDIDGPGLDRLLGELQPLGGRPRVDVVDVSDRAGIYAAAAKVKSELGAVDILVNNAGVVSGKRFLDLADEKIEKTLQVNTLALFWTAKAFLPEMIAANRGHLVTVASAAGTIGVSGLADYCASKFGAVGFDEAVRVEMKRIAPGVKTTVVCPYYIDTGMFDGVRTRFSFLLPILEADRVTRRIVRAIERDRPRVLMPFLVYLVPVLRLLPVGVFDAIAGMLGINVSMDHFTGRTVSK